MDVRRDGHTDAETDTPEFQSTRSSPSDDIKTIRTKEQVLLLIKDKIL